MKLFSSFDDLANLFRLDLLLLQLILDPIPMRLSQNGHFMHVEASYNVRPRHPIQVQVAGTYIQRPHVVTISHVYPDHAIGYVHCTYPIAWSSGLFTSNTSKMSYRAYM